MKLPILKATRGVGRFAIKHGPTILTIGGGVGVIATAIMTGRATLIASKKLEELEYTSDHVPTRKEQAKVVVPRYIPPAIICAGTVACIFGAHNMHIQKQAALAAAYAFANTRFEEYQEKVLEEYGTNRESEIKDKVAQKRIAKNPPRKDGLNVIRTKYGDILFMDSFTARYFYSSYEAVERAKIEVTRIAQRDMCASLNDFYDALDIPKCDVGDLLGWNICDINDNLGDPTISIVTNRTCKTPTPEELPCTIIDYDVEPMIDYDKL